MRRYSALVATLLLVLAFLLPAVPTSEAATPDFTDSAFQKVWNRTDSLVASLQETRTWYWGPSGLYSGKEKYAESPGGQRTVQYFDKSRMEINDPGADKNSEWYVTNGLLVKELVSGRLQTGNNQFTERAPSRTPVAGDPADANPNAPVYATFVNLASLNAEATKRASKRLGQNVSETVDKAGALGSKGELGQQPGTEIVFYDETLGHNVPKVFIDFMNASGKVVNSNGVVVNETVISWVFAMGYPVTEPYWARVKTNGVERDVLIQLFERRVLTYTPANPDGWKVEMGNVGMHYFKWRYEVTIGANPKTGPAGTTFNFNGSGFDPGEKVSAWFSAPDGSVYGFQSQAVADAEGTVKFVFASAPTIPTGQWAITAQGLGSNRLTVAYFQITAPEEQLIVSPASGPAGALFQFTVLSYKPKEQVSLWVVGPDNQTMIVVGQTAADDTGKAQFSWGTNADTEDGKWVAAARGAQSGKQTQAEFTITSP